jgi:hypothetical protein
MPLDDRRLHQILLIIFGGPVLSEVLHLNVSTDQPLPDFRRSDIHRRETSLHGGI